MHKMPWTTHASQNTEVRVYPLASFPQIWWLPFSPSQTQTYLCPCSSMAVPFLPPISHIMMEWSELPENRIRCTGSQQRAVTPPENRRHVETSHFITNEGNGKGKKRIEPKMRVSKFRKDMICSDIQGGCSVQPEQCTPNRKASGTQTAALESQGNQIPMLMLIFCRCRLSHSSKAYAHWAQKQ